jgi:dTMP kinase
MTAARCIAPQFVSFEGIDGCGKSTLVAELATWLNQAGIVHLKTREPGGTALGERIRELLLDPSTRAMAAPTEVLLYSASRAQHARECIAPALARGLWVLSDRYSDATLAYQGYGRGIELEFLRRLQDWATGGLSPHRTVLIDCPVEVAMERLENRTDHLDRIEREESDFHGRVRQGYLELASSEPRRFLVLDGTQPLDQVIDQFRRRFWEPLCAAC